MTTTVSNISPSARPGLVLGVCLALFGVPLVVGLFTYFGVPVTGTNVMIRELLNWAVAGLLLWIVFRRERRGWESLGLSRPPLGKTALWVLIGLAVVAVALALALGVIKLLGLPMGSPDGAAFAALPLGVIAFVVLRAGVLEEYFYRGYLIQRLEELTGSRGVAIWVPMVLFGLFHYRQGWAGILIAFAAGAALTWIYLRTRNLWVNILIHFFVDFVPNVVLPLFGKG